jgi:dTMP kinase
MFITLEGPEGSGKTSQIPALAEFLLQQGHRVFTTREPGGTPIGEQVRAVIMSLKNTSMSPRTETLLFCAARAQLVEEVIRPHLARHEIVLSDRYADATLAYQGYGHRHDLAQLRQLLNFATGGLWPDLTLLLDLESEAGLQRKTSHLGIEWNRMDAYEIEFHQRVRAGYLELARQEPGRWCVIDAAQPAEMVQLALRQAALERLSAANFKPEEKK